MRRPFLHRSPTNSARLSVASQFVEKRSASDSLERLSRRMSNYNAIVRVEEWEIEAMTEEAEIQAEGSARVHREARKNVDKLRDAFAVDLQELRRKRQLYDQILAGAALLSEVEGQ